MTKIIKFTVDDVRFPTSKDLTGSDAIHTDPDYDQHIETKVFQFLFQVHQEFCQ